MSIEEFEKIILPLVLLPREQHKALKDALVGNFKNWKEKERYKKYPTKK